MDDDDNVYVMEIVSDTDPDSPDASADHTISDQEIIEEALGHLHTGVQRVDEVHMDNIGDASNGPPSNVEEVEDEDATQPGVEAQEEEENNEEAKPEQEPVKEDSPVKPTQRDMSAEEDGQTCTICFEPWTSSSEHRLVSLRCGHLYGRSCISKWLKGQGSRCPQCNARARKSEIRPIYARCLKVLDTTERDRALMELDREAELRKKAEMECASLRLKYQLTLSECEILRKELASAQMLLRESRSSTASAKSVSSPVKIRSPFTLSHVIDLSSGCRVIDSNDLFDLMVVTQPSTNALFKGFGLRKISLSSMKQCEYLHLHQRTIKDVSFHALNGLILTASFDKTLKLTNCLNNSVVQTYNLDCETWSCIWDLDDPCYFYAGVRTGHIYLFDIRVTDRYVEQISGICEASPVIALQYINRDPASGIKKCGPLASHLSSCFFYEKQSPSQFQMLPLPLEGRFTSLSYELSTNHLLASCRPSLKHQRVTHTLCSVSCEGDSFQCNYVQTMNGGNSQAQLSRSKLIKNPMNDSSVLVCAGDEETKSTMIWDGSTGNLLSSFQTESPVLDMTTFSKGRKTLATLTDKTLRWYQ